MGYTLADQVLWLAELLGHIVLLWILIGRRRSARFPFFTSYIAFQVLVAVVDRLTGRFGSDSIYFWTYWSLGIVEVLLQLGIVFAMAGEVLKPAGTWSRDARTMFITIGAVGAVLAAGLSFAVDPKLGHGVYAWSARLDLFASLLIAELVVAMFITADRMGLQWRNWVMRLAEGLGLWVGIYLFVEIAHSYVGWTQRYRPLDVLSMFAYLIALGYWCISFWNEEPQRRPLSPEMQEYFAALNKNLTYDLSNLDRLRK